MSIYKVFSVFDSKAEAYMEPVTYTTKGVAIRVIQNTLKNEKSEFALHPNDYTLFELGEFCDDTGTITVHSKPVCLGTITEYLNDIER